MRLAASLRDVDKMHAVAAQQLSQRVSVIAAAPPPHFRTRSG